VSVVPAVTPHTNAMLSRLRSSGLLVGDGRRPAGSGWQGAPGQSVFVPWLVLQSLNHNRQGPDASIADRSTQPVLRYQVTAVGEDREAAETASDIAAKRLLNRVPLDIEGWRTVLLVHELSMPAEPDEAVNPPVFYVVDRYRLDTQKVS
jgi:hypothetical protein